jgi:hypothetical protein
MAHRARHQHSSRRPLSTAGRRELNALSCRGQVTPAPDVPQGIGPVDLPIVGRGCGGAGVRY